MTSARPSLSPPIVIAHRGASGLRPEHTIAAYELAIEQGADVIEPDLMPTKEDVLVARHENDISDTTDIPDHPEFTGPRTPQKIEGKPTNSWFTEEFPLATPTTVHTKEPT